MGDETLMINRIHLFYHNSDQDGFMSAFLINWAIENDVIDIKRKIDKVKFYPFNINFNVPFEKIKEDDIVFFTDISAQPDEMLIIWEKTNHKMFWIDHHKSILEEHKTLYKKVHGLINIEQSAVENAYDLIIEMGSFTEETKKVFESLYKLVKIVGIQDTHRLDEVDYDLERWFDEIDSVVKAMDSTDTDINNDGKVFWDWVLSTDIDEVISDLRGDGLIILDYIRKRNFSMVRSYSFPIEFEGLKVLVLNQGIGGSMIFESKDLTGFDAVMCYVYNGKRDNYSVSLYSTDTTNDIDLYENLKHVGFKGHAGAGGLRSKKMNFVKKDGKTELFID